jgi:endonuclease/exonuclease/phosphatase family metal-dependent hydrolase
VRKTIRFAHYNIGLLLGGIKGKRKDYIQAGIKPALLEFFQRNKELPHYYKKESAKVRLAKIIRYVRNANIEVLTLNEADFHFPRNQIDIIAKKTGLRHVQHAFCYGLPFIFENNNVVMSKYPFVAKKKIHTLPKIQAHDWKIEVLTRVDYYTRKMMGKIPLLWRRRALVTEINFGSFTYKVICTHFDDNEKSRTAQAVELRKIIEEEGPCIVSLDCNDTHHFKQYYPYGDADHVNGGFSGTTLTTLESVVNKKSLPQQKQTMLKENGIVYVVPEYTAFDKNGTPMHGTYPVMLKRKKNKLILDENRLPDRKIDYTLPMLEGKIKARLVSYRIALETGSDHLPVEADIEFEY